MNLPKVSVVMASYNRADIIKDAVDSILEQSLPNIELLLVDDCSTDNSWPILKALEKEDERVIILRTNRNSGPSIAYNMGIELARGKYIAIMDDDDISLKDRLRCQSDILDNDSTVGVVGSSISYFDEKGRYPFTYPSGKVIRHFPSSSEKVFEDVYLEKYIIPNPSIMVRSDLLKHMKYPPLRGLGVDMIMLLQLAALGSNFHLIPEPLVLMRRGKQHTRMTKKFRDIHNGRIKKYNYIRMWLEKNHIHKFDNLHSKALKNISSKYLLDLAAGRGIIGGLPAYIFALIRNPSFVFSQTIDLYAQYLFKLKREY